MIDPIFDKLEPEAKVDDTTFNAATSQAISLKRIADALEKLISINTSNVMIGHTFINFDPDPYKDFKS